MKFWKSVSVLSVVLLTACGGNPNDAPSNTGGDEIRVLSAGPLEDALLTIAEDFRSTTGHNIVLTTGTTPVVREHLEAGESFDVVIGTQAVVDEAAARGQVDASTSPEVGRVGVGIAVRNDLEIPAITTVDELRDLLLSADTVAYNQGSSGVYSQSMIEGLGIAEAITEATTRYANGTQVIAHVRDGQGRDLGLAPMTEIQANASEGVRMIPLPDAVQNHTAYHAVVGTDAVDSAADFIQYLLTPESREVFRATGVE